MTTYTHNIVSAAYTYTTFGLRTLHNAFLKPTANTYVDCKRMCISENEAHTDLSIAKFAAPILVTAGLVYFGWLNAPTAFLAAKLGAKHWVARLALKVGVDVVAYAAISNVLNLVWAGAAAVGRGAKSAYGWATAVKAAAAAHKDGDADKSGKAAGGGDSKAEELAKMKLANAGQ